MKSISVTQYYDLDDPKLFTGAVRNDAGDIFWLKCGNLHREDGPAVEYSDGLKNWMLDGMAISEEEHKRRTEWIRTSVGKLILKTDGHFNLENK